MSKQKWTKVADRSNCHRVFRHRDGRLAIADESGATPDDTDDGPLWLTGGDAEIRYSRHAKRMVVDYPVEDCSGEFAGRVLSELHVLPSLDKAGYDFSLADSVLLDLAALDRIGIKVTAH